MSNHLMITEERIRHLLTTRQENEHTDYKRDLPVAEIQACAFLDLLKDIVAIANSGGGVIVFGVEDNGYTPVGLRKARERKPIDETHIRSAIQKYLDTDLGFEFVHHTYEGKEFAFLGIESRIGKRPLTFQSPAVCRTCGQYAGSKHFLHGQAYVREKGSTRKATDEWIAERFLRAQERTSTSGDTEKRIDNNLPNRNTVYEEFVGRNDQVRRVIELLADKRRRITWIRGSGGIGKTTLAYRVAQMIVNGDIAAEVLAGDFDYVVWASAKETRLTTNGVAELVPQFTCLNDIVRSILSLTAGLVSVPESEVREITSVDDALTVLNPVLNQLTGLLVADNMETVTDDEVLKFLETLPGTTRAIVTTRHSMDPSGSSTVELEPLSWEDAKELILNEASRAGTYWVFQNESILEKVIEVTAKIPLAIRLVVPLISSPDAIDQYRTAVTLSQAKLLEFCYRETFSTLTEDERLLFFAIAEASEPAMKNDLAFLAGVDLNDFDAANQVQYQLEQLWHLSLTTLRKVSPTEFRYDMIPLVRQFGRQELQRDSLAKRKLRTRRALLDTERGGNIKKMCGEAADVFKRNRDFDQFTETMKSCTRKDPSSALPWLLLAEAYEARGVPSKTRETLTEARRRCLIDSPEKLRIAALQMKLDLADSKYNEVVDLFFSECSYAQSDACCIAVARAHFEIGRKHSRNKKQDSASASFYEAVDFARQAASIALRKKNKELQAAAFSLWAHASRQNDPEMSLQACERALELEAADSEDLRRLQAKLQKQLPSRTKMDLLNEHLL